MQHGPEPIARGVATVAGAGAVSRLSGFLRDILLAAVLGAGALAEAFVAAFLIPNLLRRLLGEGALNASFAPIFARRRAESGSNAARRFSGAALSGVALMGGAALLLGLWAMPSLIDAVAPGFSADPDKRANAVVFGRLMLPFVLLALLSAVHAAVLNAVGRIALAAWTPVGVNLTIALALAAALAAGLSGSRAAALLVCATILTAGCLQLAVFVLGARKVGLGLRPVAPWGDPAVKRLLLAALPAGAIAGAGHVNVLVAAQTASATPSALAWLYYADRVFQLPLGVVAAVLGVVLLPAAARDIASGDTAKGLSAQTSAIGYGLLLTLPAACGLGVLAHPVASLLYERGAFSPADAAGVGRLLAIMAAALPGFALVSAILPGFLAREDIGRPLAAAVFGMAANFAAGWALAPRFGADASAFGIVAAAWTNAVILALLAFHAGRLPIRAIAARAGPVIGASLASAAVVALMAWIASPWLAAGVATPIRAACLAGIIALVIATHLAAAQVFGAADWRSLRAALARRSHSSV